MLHAEQFQVQRCLLDGRSRCVAVARSANSGVHGADSAPTKSVTKMLLNVFKTSENVFA